MGRRKWQTPNMGLFILKMTKENVLEILKNTYCRIKPSKTEGVGVFAIRDIPENTNPFYGSKQKWFKFNILELKDFDKEILELINDFFVIEEDKTVLIPEFGLNGMDISFFLNHSENPNIETKDGGFNFITLKKIKKGEELLVSYGTYDNKWK